MRELCGAAPALGPRAARRNMEPPLAGMKEPTPNQIRPELRAPPGRIHRRRLGLERAATSLEQIHQRACHWVRSARIRAAREVHALLGSAGPEVVSLKEEPHRRRGAALAEGGDAPLRVRLVAPLHSSGCDRHNPNSGGRPLCVRPRWRWARCQHPHCTKSPSPSQPAAVRRATSVTILR